MASFFDLARQRASNIGADIGTLFRRNVSPTARVGSLFGVGGAVLGLPEFGVSEKARISTPQAAAPTQIRFRTPAEEAQLQAFDVAQKAGQTTPSSGGGGGGDGGGGGQPQPSGDQNLPLEQAPTLQEPQFDIGPALAALSQAEQATRTESEAAISQTEASRQKAVGRVQSAQELQERGLTKQEERETGRVESAIGEQRRGFAEIAQQFLGRFGRTGFGQGVLGEISQRTLQNIGQARTALQETLDNIRFETTRVREESRRSIDDIEAQAESFKQQARSELQRSLAQIAAERGQVQLVKSRAQFDALQRYTDTIQEVNTRNTAFKQQIYLQDQANMQKAQQAEQRNVNQFFNYLEKAARAVDVGLLTPQEARSAVEEFTGTTVSPSSLGVGVRTEREEEDRARNLVEGF